MTSFWPLVLVAAGCMPAAPVRWLREDVHPVAVHGDRRLDHVRIWTHDQMLEWRDVLVTRDSISGIPYVSAQSDSSRRALPTALVDSLKVGYSTVANAKGSHDDWWVPLVLVCALLCPYP